ncbi:hypothetical protein [Novosphingobium barchaimii]|nr:hypothetical protein [Novosphingobium barchaimii]
MTENPEIGVFVHIPNPAGFFVQPDRGGGVVVSVPVSHARIHVFYDMVGVIAESGRKRTVSGGLW